MINWKDQTERKLDMMGGEIHEDTPQARIVHLGVFITEQLVRKNKNYGNSALTPPIMAPEVSNNQALRVRMSDKLKRILALEGGEPDKVGESLADTYIDFAGYSILLALEALERLEEKELTRPELPPRPILDGPDFQPAHAATGDFDDAT